MTNIAQQPIPVSLTLTEEQLYALLNLLIDTVRSDEEHVLEPVLDSIGEAVSAYEKATGIDEVFDRLILTHA